MRLVGVGAPGSGIVRPGSPPAYGSASSSGAAQGSPQPRDDVLAHHERGAVGLRNLRQLPRHQPARRVEGPAPQVCGARARAGRRRERQGRPRCELGRPAVSAEASQTAWPAACSCAAPCSPAPPASPGPALAPAPAPAPRTREALAQLHSQHAGHGGAQAVPRHHHLPALQLQLGPAARRGQGRARVAGAGVGCLGRGSTGMLRSGRAPAHLIMVCARSRGSSTSCSPLRIVASRRR